MSAFLFKLWDYCLSQHVIWSLRCKGQHFPNSSTALEFRKVFILGNCWRILTLTFLFWYWPLLDFSPLYTPWQIWKVALRGHNCFLSRIKLKDFFSVSVSWTSFEESKLLIPDRSLGSKESCMPIFKSLAAPLVVILFIVSRASSMESKRRFMIPVWSQDWFWHYDWLMTKGL